jgi:hypothetical protein
VNHNEIERKRRNAQKERLEELRMCIPVLANQERASTVSIIMRAREYIDQLRTRILELERYVHSTGGTGAPGPNIAMKQGVPIQRSLGQVPGYTPIAPNPRVELNPALLLAEAASTLPSIERPPPPQRQIPKPPEPALIQKRDSSSGDDFLSLLQARKSSLILPAEDGIFFGKRSDSIHHFLTSGLSAVLEESVQVDIRCGKCARGIENLIMVDCESCHSWYHIRCLGMDANNIPVNWRCAECVFK